MTTTRFSIIITSYNQSNYIEQAIESALSQNYPHKEIIVVDDASTDGSQQILEQYGGKIKLNKCGSNHGASRARNLGASIAIGDYLVFLDGDDALLPWALAVYDGIADTKNPKLILGTLFWCKSTIPAVKCNELAKEVKVVDYDTLVRKDRMYRGCASALVVDRKTFFDVNGWTNDFFPGEVDDMLIKLGFSGRTIQICSPPTISYRVHEHNTVHQISGFVQMMQRIIRKERAGEYSGKAKHRRYAFIGGPVFYWAKTALKTQYRVSGFKLLATGSPMILAAIIHRLFVKVKGKRPVETVMISLMPK